MTPDALLLPRVASGDQAAVRACIDRFGGLVWSLARRMLATEAEAEDAVQEIFVDVWQSAYRYDASVASETAFVAMIARRRLIDRRRKIGRRPSEQALGEHEPARNGSEVEAPAMMRDELGRAAEAFEQLSTEQRRVLRLSVFHGLSHEKIARATGLPLGTVKTHARRGLIRLRDLMRQGAAGTADGDGEGSTPGGDAAARNLSGEVGA